MGRYLAAIRLISPPNCEPRNACASTHPRTTGLAGSSASGSLSMASDDSRTPSPVTTTLSPSLCLHAAIAVAKQKPSNSGGRPILMPRISDAGNEPRTFSSLVWRLTSSRAVTTTEIGDVAGDLHVKEVVPAFSLDREGLQGLHRPRLDRFQVDTALRKPIEAQSKSAPG